MGDDCGGDGVSRNSSRRRNAKQERALYQPGKGLASGGGGSVTGGSSEKDEYGHRNYLHSAGSNDPMDAVQQKLKEMSMRGPPPEVMGRFTRGRRDEDHDNRYHQQRQNRDRNDFRRFPQGKASLESNWRYRNDREVARQPSSRMDSRESFHSLGGGRNSFQEPPQRTNARDLNPRDYWDSNQRRRRSRERNEIDKPKKYLWRQDVKPQERGSSAVSRNENPVRIESDRRYSREKERCWQPPAPVTASKQSVNSPRSPESSEEELDSIEQPTQMADANLADELADDEEVAQITVKEPERPRRLDWTECPTPPPPTLIDESIVTAPALIKTAVETDELKATSRSKTAASPAAAIRNSVSSGAGTSPTSTHSGVTATSSEHGSPQSYEIPQRRRLDSDASNWSQNSGGRIHRPRQERKKRDGSWENGRSDQRYRSPWNAKNNRRVNETLPPRFQKQREAQRKMQEMKSEKWERQESDRTLNRSDNRNPQKNQNFCGGNTVETGLANRSKQTKPLMTVRPVPQVRDESEAGLKSATMQRQPKEAVSKNLQEAQELEAELMARLADAVQMPNGIQQLAELRSKIQVRYEHIVLHDSRFSAEKNIEQLLWKAVYHQIIEALRREIDFGTRSPDEIRSEICSIVEEGSQYYENLLEQLQGLHDFKLDKVLQSDPPRNLGSNSSVKMVMISAQKMLICLGDLCRYRERALDSANFAKARDYYLRAQQIAPKNGKPYNQLALLAVYSRRKLDAVYYYMRSLAVSNPFLTAKESLTTLFDEVRKKYEAQEKVKKQMEARKSNARMALPEQARCEIWIRPDGSSWQRREDSELEQKLDMIEELNAMPDFELLKQFTSSFLHVHGKLFSKIGMDQFPDAAKPMLLELRCLLKRPLGPGGGARYLQLLAICIFSVANNSLKNTEALDSNARSLMQEHSVQIAMAFVTHLMERCTEKVDDFLRQRSDSEKRILPDDVEELLPVLKIWTDWMSGHKKLWCPPPNVCEFNTSTKGDVWTAMADMLNSLQSAESFRSEEVSRIFSSAVNSPVAEEVVLPEDNTMAGFVPLLNSPIDPCRAGPIPPEHRDSFRTMMRINRLNYFADYLCGMKKPYLSYDVARRTYGSLIVDNAREHGDCGEDEDNLDVEYESVETRSLAASYELAFAGYKAKRDVGSASEAKRGIFQQTSPSEPSDNDDENKAETGACEEATTEVDKLRRKKRTLQKRMKRQNRVKAYIERVLNHHRGTTILEICPRYLIPDTNCLVDHLDLIQRLVACKKFSIYVPIVVVNELDGLTRGTKNSSGARAHQDPEHAARVTAFAQEALSYLREMFNAREPKLRTITSRGNLLDSIAFRTETGTDNAGSNDDLILSCAVSLCKEHHLQPGETEAPLKLFREAVLLTADRNLAVKAIAHNVPVRDLASFIRWAQVPLLEQIRQS